MDRRTAATTRSRTVPRNPTSTALGAGGDHADDHGGGHGHGPWHGPHESPTPMTFPLMALAVGAIVAGFVGIPAALGGGNPIEHFLEPSFVASSRAPRAGCGGGRSRSGAGRGRARGEKARAARVARGRARADGFLGADRRDRHRPGVAVLRHESGDLREPGRADSPARIARCRTSTTSTSFTTRRSSPGRWRRAAGCGPSIATSSTARSTDRAG